MIRKRPFLLSLLVVLCIVGDLQFVSIASIAATPLGMVVAPAIESLSLSPMQNSATFSTSITNKTTQTQQVQISFEDFTALGTNGAISLLSQPNKQHGLAAAMSAAPSSFSIHSQATQTIQITIANFLGLTFGGHYGAVLYKVANPLSSPKNNSAIFKQSIATLVFISTQGHGTYSLSVPPIQQGISWFHAPTLYNVVVNNTGNVQLTPRGYLNLSGPFHEQIAKGLLNTGSGLVLPDSGRLFMLQTSPIHTAFWPGIYTLKLYYSYDGSSTTNIVTSHFFFVNLWLILIVPILLVVVIGLLRRHFSKRVSHKYLRRQT